MPENMFDLKYSGGWLMEECQVFTILQDDEYSSCIICQHTTRSILRFCITEQACAAFYILRTSLEDLGAATCKLVNFVDHKV